MYMLQGAGCGKPTEGDIKAVLFRHYIDLRRFAAGRAIQRGSGEIEAEDLSWARRNYAALKKTEASRN